jgi:hypothetical protein
MNESLEEALIMIADAIKELWNKIKNNMSKVSGRDTLTVK